MCTAQADYVGIWLCCLVLGRWFSVEGRLSAEGNHPAGGPTWIPRSQQDAERAFVSNCS